MTTPLDTDIRETDVVIIGGGIQGAGIAQACAAAGYRCTLVEKSHLAAGTSSQSSKLIHGGLRYLETCQFGLVRHNLQERERLLKLAPDLIQRRDFLIPIYPHSHRGPWLLRAGLALYRVLAGQSPFGALFSDSQSAYSLNKRDWPQLAGLNTQGLSHVFRYEDAQTDDRLLTQAVMYSAESLGAQLLCPVEVERIEQNLEGIATTANGEQTPSEASDHYAYDLFLSDAHNTCAPQHLRAKVVINATGPWVNQLLERIMPEPEVVDVDLVQGSHLLLSNQLGEHAYYLEAPSDKRAVFVIPWQGKTLLGTTELVHHGHPEEAAMTEGERNYLLRTFRHYFPDIRPDVLGSFCGLRVLPKGKDSAFARPREVQLHSPNDHPHLLSVYGGKLTGYRHTAERVCEWVAGQLGPRIAIADTAELALELPPGALPARAIPIQEKAA